MGKTKRLLILSSLFCLFLSCISTKKETYVVDNVVDEKEITKEESQYIYDSIVKKEVYTIVEVWPRYPGGEAQFHRDLMENIIITDWDTYTVYFCFVIDTDGSLIGERIITNKKETKTELKNTEKAVLEGIKALNDTQWTPGLINGKPVPVFVYGPLRLSPAR